MCMRIYRKLLLFIENQGSKSWSRFCCSREHFPTDLDFFRWQSIIDTFLLSTVSFHCWHLVSLPSFIVRVCIQYSLWSNTNRYTLLIALNNFRYIDLKLKCKARVNWPQLVIYQFFNRSIVEIHKQIHIYVKKKHIYRSSNLVSMPFWMEFHKISIRLFPTIIWHSVVTIQRMEMLACSQIYWQAHLN